MDRRRLRPPHDVERDGLMRVAAETADLKVGVARFERVAECRRRLAGHLEATTRLVDASQASLSACRRASGRDADRGAVKPTAEAAATPGINVSQFPHSE